MKDKLKPRKVIKTLDDFCKTYIPNYAEKYPITMMVSQEEEYYILTRRGNYGLSKPKEG